MKKRIAVLVSGGGTNLQALLDAEEAGMIPHGEIALVVSNKEGAYALERARNHGVPGAVIASLSLAAPCVIVILLVIRVLDKFKGSPLVDSIFKALRPASIGMITAALIGVVKESLLYLGNFAGLNTLLSVFNWKGIVLAVVLWFVMKKWKTHPIAYIAIAAVAGIVFSF